MSIFEDTNPHEFKELHDQLRARDMALPGFQREFVWEPYATEFAAVQGPCVGQ